MKKYLMMGAAALLMGASFTSCSNDKDLYDPQANAMKFLQDYQAAFISVFGTPAANQTWGFGTTTAGSRMTRSGNMTGVTPVAQTSDGINANANEWADVDPNAPHGHGGWLVPDPLTAEQKAVVAAYFQTVKDITYTDPQWPNFFVQQVYKGGNTTVRNTTEGITAADGTNAYTSTNMNLLTVGDGTAEHHINNFNAGTYSGSGLNTYEGAVNNDGTVNVLDNGYTVNDFAEHHHADQIMLMVNIDDTKCMGYHCSATGVSLQRNDKAALVDWETIRTWANANGLNGDCLNDGWNRSFVGFDLALKSQEDSYAKGENDEALYATFYDVPDNNEMLYAWNGDDDNLMKIGEAPAAPAGNKQITGFTAGWNTTIENGVATTGQYGGAMWSSGINHENWTSYTKLVIKMKKATTATMKLRIQKDGADKFTYDIPANTENIEIDLTGADISDVTGVGFDLGEGTFEFDEIYLVGTEAYEYYDPSQLSLRLLDANMNQYAGESRTITDADLKKTVNGKICLNLKTINDLLADGFLPVSGSAFKTWAKWADSDGYFSDWIVTLTKAKKQSEEPTPDYYNTPNYRVICEDLTVSDSGNDFDFNDVVFDVFYNNNNAAKAKIRLKAAGGTLPLRICDKNGNLVVLLHQGYKALVTDMVNTNAGPWVADKEYEMTIDKSLYDDGIKLYVDKTSKDGNANTEIDDISNSELIELTALKGHVAAKIKVDNTYEWCQERVDINTCYPDFQEYVKDPSNYWPNEGKPKWWANKAEGAKVINR